FGFVRASFCRRSAGIYGCHCGRPHAGSASVATRDQGFRRRAASCSRAHGGGGDHRHPQSARLPSLADSGVGAGRLLAPLRKSIAEMNSTEACIALNMLPTVGPVRPRKLLEVFETPERALTAKRHELRAVEGIGGEVADQIAAWESTVDLPAELNRIRDFGATVITQELPSYPRSLREIHAPPIVLYVWGELQERDNHAIGIIGARRTTHYGTESAKKLAYQIAYAGLTVISGLARGIDTAAHQGALAAKGRTIAVIGSGLSKLYPPENAALAEKIRNGNGAVVSEFSMEIEPDRQTFPMRNRIISGWSQGILVVEAGA